MITTIVYAHDLVFIVIMGTRLRGFRIIRCPIGGLIRWGLIGLEGGVTLGMDILYF
jgi:hypothetical protein